MKDQQLLLEMIIVAIICIPAVLWGIWFLIKYKEDKFHKGKSFVLTAVITLSVMFCIFETVWFCMYLGLPV